MDGRLVQIGLIGGSRAALDFAGVLQKRLTITGSTLRARTPAEKGAIARELERARLAAAVAGVGEARSSTPSFRWSAPPTRTARSKPARSSGRPCWLI